MLVVKDFSLQSLYFTNHFLFLCNCIVKQNNIHFLKSPLAIPSHTIQSILELDVVMIVLLKAL